MSGHAITWGYPLSDLFRKRPEGVEAMRKKPWEHTWRLVRYRAEWQEKLRAGISMVWVYVRDDGRIPKEIHENGWTYHPVKVVREVREPMGRPLNARKTIYW